MSIVSACITPHSPMLLPTVGKEKMADLANTVAALNQLERELYVSQPETILVITPHGESAPDTLTIDLSPKYTADFSRFGDLVTKTQWRSDMMLVNQLREYAKSKHLPLMLSSAESLDYGTAVPLTYLTQHLPNIKIIPLSVSNLDIKTHYNLGKELKDELMHSTTRIAIIGSADLSHRAGENSPAGLSPAGVAFDKAVCTLVAENRLPGIVDINDADAAEAQACGSGVLATMFGMLDEMKYKVTVLCYDKPFGVGYLTAQMRIE